MVEWRESILRNLTSASCQGRGREVGGIKFFKAFISASPQIMCSKSD
jgi:hypothetical protein